MFAVGPHNTENFEVCCWKSLSQRIDYLLSAFKLPSFSSASRWWVVLMCCPSILHRVVVALIRVGAQPFVSTHLVLLPIPFNAVRQHSQTSACLVILRINSSTSYGRGSTKSFLFIEDIRPVIHYSLQAEVEMVRSRETGLGLQLRPVSRTFKFNLF
jgi:hypothetical protein